MATHIFRVCLWFGKIKKRFSLYCSLKYLYNLVTWFYSYHFSLLDSPRYVIALFPSVRHHIEYLFFAESIHLILLVYRVQAVVSCICLPAIIRLSSIQYIIHYFDVRKHPPTIPITISPVCEDIRFSLQAIQVWGTYYPPWAVFEYSSVSSAATE